MNDLLPRAIHDLLKFYEDSHADARFGELDLPTLQTIELELKSSATNVESAERALNEVRERHWTVEAEAAVKASRIVAFLKIHVEGHEEHSAQLVTIGEDLANARRKTRSITELAVATAEPRPKKARGNKTASAEQRVLINDDEDPEQSASVDAEAQRTPRARPVAQASGATAATH